MGSFFSVAFTFFLVIDALGTLPVYLSLIKDLKKKEVYWITFREMAVALLLMGAFLYVGEFLLKLLTVSKTTVEISGGVILFLIAVRLVFSHEMQGGKWKRGSLLIVPIATPLIAGPSTFAVITIFGQSDLPNSLVFAALAIAWLISYAIYWLAKPIYAFIGERGLMAAQRLMGLLIALIATQMLLEGIHDLIQSGV